MTEDAEQRLAESEWKFDSVPMEQLEACYLYEYARGFFKISPILQTLRRKWVKYKDDAKARDLEASDQALDLLRTRCTTFPDVDFNYFPGTAWLDLPILTKTTRRGFDIDMRQRAADRVKEWAKRNRENPGDSFHIETLRQCEPPNIRTLEAFRRYHEFFHHEKKPGETEYGFFAINWSHSDPQIKRAFSAWLDDQRQERKQQGLNDPKTKSNRGGFRDKLRWLGALRVMEFYKQKCNRRTDWVTHPEQMLKPEVKAPYSYYPDLSDAAKKAKQEIARLFPQAWNARRWRREREERSRVFQEAIRNPASPFYMGDEGVGSKV